VIDLKKYRTMDMLLYYMKGLKMWKDKKLELMKGLLIDLQ